MSKSQLYASKGMCSSAAVQGADLWKKGIWTSQYSKLFLTASFSFSWTNNFTVLSPCNRKGNASVSCIIPHRSNALLPVIGSMAQTGTVAEGK